ncbi:MAG: hypothetical protein HY787_25600 [Deltaproteobacteria bacterium]|nr:hypothetical protein [Deltaproteobacteria bacterium]
MAISNKGPFTIGALLAFSFVGVLILIFSPIYGGGMNGLDYADDLFNKLSKGSSYFIPKLKEANQGFQGKAFAVAIQVEKSQEADLINKLFSAAGSKVEVQGTDIKIEGDLGKTVDLILKDSDLMFHNQGKEVKTAYEVDEKEVMRAWWTALSKMDKFFKKNLKIEEANHISEVSKKGIEPAYNFYKIEPQRVIDRAGLMTFLLAFYVFYTLWWGYAIFYLFDGVGLTMKKAKVKKEV